MNYWRARLHTVSGTFSATGLPSVALIAAIALSGSLTAQSSKDPLTNDQVEQVRDTGDQPAQRIKLYMKFIDDRAQDIHKIASNSKPSISSNARLHNLMEEFTRLSDELQDNLETYSEEHADMRKALKELVDHAGKWKTVLQEPKASADYDFARKTALDTADSTTELAQKVLTAQETYFTTHKAPKPGDRTER
jgi:hypothetical protein